MIELLRHPVVIPGRVPSMANIGMNWRVAKIPLEKIKNAVTRQKKVNYQYAMGWRDLAVFMVREAALGMAPTGTAVFVHAHLQFKPAKGRTNPADLPQDCDNPSKGILDALQKSGIVENDKQVIMLLLDKTCAAAETQATIMRVTAGKPRDKKRWLASLEIHGL